MIRPLYLDDLTGAVRAGGLTDVLQWWQTFTVHAQGIGQQDLPIVIPYDLTAIGIRYRIKAAGTGGSMVAELRRGTSSTTLAGSSATPDTAPSWTTVSINLDQGDLIWAAFTSVNDTPGVQMKAELLVVRR